MLHPDTLRALPSIETAALLGSWRIVETNFPMWLSGARQSPTLNYAATESASRLDDTVRYQTPRGQVREICGVDTQDPACSAHFTWRGRGLLALLSSDWYIVHHDDATGVAAIFFLPTWFTPAGVDVIARGPATPEARAAARAGLTAAGLGGQVATLVVL